MNNTEGAVLGTTRLGWLWDTIITVSTTSRVIWKNVNKYDTINSAYIWLASVNTHKNIRKIPAQTSQKNKQVCPITTRPDTRDLTSTPVSSLAKIRSQQHDVGRQGSQQWDKRHPHNEYRPPDNISWF